jgi:oligosaccharide repeat unit polymerase
MTLIVKLFLINGLGLLFCSIINKYLSRRTGTVSPPINLYIYIWVIVLCSTALISNSTINLFYNINIGILLLTPVCVFMLFSRRLKVEKLINNKYISDSFLNSFFFRSLISICVLFRVFQILKDYFVIKNLDGNILALLSDSQWLRIAYLNYSDKISGFIQKAEVNILNYMAEVGFFLSCIYAFKIRKYLFFVISIILSLVHSLVTMSKLAFFIDACIAISVYLIIVNLHKPTTIKEMKKEKRTRRGLVFFIATFILILLIVTSMQRGYQNKTSGIEGIDNIVVSKAIAYVVTPFMAFRKILTQDIDYSYGAKTFNPFFKIFGIGFENFGTIDVGIDDSTVYTLPGMFFADFGYIGSFILLALYSFIVWWSYKRTIEYFTISRLSLFCMINVTLLMSFFTWMGRITFFWLFPVFVFVLEKFVLKIKKNKRKEKLA